MPKEFTILEQHMINNKLKKELLMNKKELPLLEEDLLVQSVQLHWL